MQHCELNNGGRQIYVNHINWSPHETSVIKIQQY